jgi:hypothetical protein
MADKEGIAARAARAREVVESYKREQESDRVGRERSGQIWSCVALANMVRRAYHTHRPMCRTHDVLPSQVVCLVLSVLKGWRYLAPVGSIFVPPVLYDVRMSAHVLGVCFVSTSQAAYAAWVEPSGENVHSSASGMKLGIFAVLALWLECRYQAWEFLVTYVTGVDMCQRPGEDWLFVAVGVWLVRVHPPQIYWPCALCCCARGSRKSGGRVPSSPVSLPIAKPSALSSGVRVVPRRPVPGVGGYARGET